MVSVGDFDFRGGVVVQGLVQAGCVPPVDPLHRGQFDGLDGLPQVFGMDEFGLVEPVDGFGQGVVVGVAHGAHGGCYPCGDECLRVCQADILGAFVAVVDQAFMAAAGACAQQGVLESQQW